MHRSQRTSFGVTILFKSRLRGDVSVHVGASFDAFGSHLDSLVHDTRNEAALLVEGLGPGHGGHKRHSVLLPHRLKLISLRQQFLIVLPRSRLLDLLIALPTSLIRKIRHRGRSL